MHNPILQKKKFGTMKKKAQTPNAVQPSRRLPWFRTREVIDEPLEKRPSNAARSNPKTPKPYPIPFHPARSKNPLKGHTVGDNTHGSYPPAPSCSSSNQCPSPSGLTTSSSLNNRFAAEHSPSVPSPHPNAHTRLPHGRQNLYSAT